MRRVNIMCLHKIVRHYRSNTKVYEGYKIFNVYISSKYIYPEFYNNNRQLVPISVGEWLTATQRSVFIDKYEGIYKSGFHIFHKLEDAKAWKSALGQCIYKVEYKNRRIKGIQFYKGKERVIIVADKMRVVEEIKIKE